MVLLKLLLLRLFGDGTKDGLLVSRGIGDVSIDGYVRERVCVLYED